MYWCLVGVALGNSLILLVKDAFVGFRGEALAVSLAQPVALGTQFSRKTNGQWQAGLRANRLAIGH